MTLLIYNVFWNTNNIHWFKWVNFDNNKPRIQRMMNSSRFRTMCTLGWNIYCIISPRDGYYVRVHLFGWPRSLLLHTLRVACQTRRVNNCRVYLEIVQRRETGLRGIEVAIVWRRVDCGVRHKQELTSTIMRPFAAGKVNINPLLLVSVHP